MNLTRSFAVTLLAGTAYAAALPMSLKWNELRVAIANERVIVDLKDGSRVRGVAISVLQSTLEVNVSSNAHPTYKKGQAAIPRDTIAGLQLIRMRKRGRILGTSVGTLSGLVAGGAMEFESGSKLSCPPGIFIVDALIDGLCSNSKRSIVGEAAGFAVMAALPVAGYLVGRRNDRQEIRITIRPD